MTRWTPKENIAVLSLLLHSEGKRWKRVHWKLVPELSNRSQNAIAMKIRYLRYKAKRWRPRSGT